MGLRRGGVLAPLLAVCLMGCSGQQLLNGLTPTGGYTKEAGIAYGDLPRQRLDIYVPKPRPEAGAPVVVFFYGGRWSEGSRQGYRFLAQALTSRGWIAVIPDYRLYPEVRFPAFVEDGAAALVWTRTHIADYGGNTQRFYVMGHSAGAHIAALLALDPHYLAEAGGSRDWLTGFIGLSGPYDFLPPDAEDLKQIFGPPKRYPQGDPINFAGPGAPPMLLVHGTADDTVEPEDTRLLAAAICKAGGSARTVFLEGVDHVGAVANLAALLRYRRNALSAIERFIGRSAGGHGYQSKSSGTGCSS